jgi:hypothetical protein
LPVAQIAQTVEAVVLLYAPVGHRAQAESVVWFP